MDCAGKLGDDANKGKAQVGPALVGAALTAESQELHSLNSFLQPAYLAASVESATLAASCLFCVLHAVTEGLAPRNACLVDQREFWDQLCSSLADKLGLLFKVM